MCHPWRAFRVDSYFNVYARLFKCLCRFVRRAFIDMCVLFSHIAHRGQISSSLSRLRFILVPAAEICAMCLVKWFSPELSVIIVAG